jgi:hypothetical protein
MSLRRHGFPRRPDPGHEPKLGVFQACLLRAVELHAGNGNNTLLQVGVGATVRPDPGFPWLSSVSYWGWTEWTPAGYVVNNFEVQADDTVSVLDCALQPGHLECRLSDCGHALGTLWILWSSLDNPQLSVKE